MSAPFKIEVEGNTSNLQTSPHNVNRGKTSSSAKRKTMMNSS